MDFPGFLDQHKLDKKVFGEVIPKSYRRFFGEALDLHTSELDLQRFLLAADGSVSSLSGGDAVIIHYRNNKILRIRIPVDGNLEEITSYHTELHAILGMSLLLWNLIPPALHYSNKGILWIDSELPKEKNTKQGEQTLFE